MTAHIIAVANCKGGTGKSTTAVNVAAALAAEGQRVLVVDLDPQGHAGMGFGVAAPHATAGAHALFLDPDLDARDLVRASATENVAVIPADPQFRARDAADKPIRLAGALAPLRNDYDTIVIDTPPSVELPLTAALAAADGVLIPAQLQHLAHDGLKQFSRLFFATAITINPALTGFAIVPVQVDMRTHLQRFVLAQLLRDFGGSRIFRGIRNDIALAEAFGHGCPVSSHKPGSRGAVDYSLLAADITTFWIDQSSRNKDFAH